MLCMQIKSSTSSAAKESQDSDLSLSLKEFFASQGLEVIDKRPSGGNLWVIGDEDKMAEAVDKAKSIYGISGNYGSGKATKKRPGWFTSSDK